MKLHALPPMAGRGISSGIPPKPLVKADHPCRLAAPGFPLPSKKRQVILAKANKGKRMPEQRTFMGISELSRRSEVPIPTIKFYLRKKLLHSPVKTSKTMAYYTLEHLEKLKCIKRLQRKERFSLDHIKELLDSAPGRDPGGVGENSVEFSAREKRIIDAAIELFKDQGYEITTIADIVDAAHISKSTFYMHFANKKELFEKCFKRIFKGFVAESLEAIGDETDIIEVFRKIPLPLIRNYSKWNAMLSQLRAASVYDAKNFGDKFEEVLDMFAEPISFVLDIAKRKGQLKNINTKLLAVMFQGMLDYTNYYQARGRFGLDVEEFIEQGLDIILHGALKQPP